MRIAVVGATGFIGRHVIHALSEKGMEVISVDRDHPKQLEKSGTFVRADLAAKGAAAEAAAACGAIDAVAWLAATIHQGSVVDEAALEDLQVMVEAPLRFLEALPQPPSVCVYISSIQVYGAPQYLPMDEAHPTNPIRAYGVAKLCAEHFLRIYGSAHHIPVTSLRLSFVYGPGQHGANVLPRFIETVQKGERPVIHGDGSGKRDDVYVGDVAKAIALSISKKAAGSFNIASGVCHTTLDVARTVCRIGGLEQGPRFDDAPSAWVNRCFTTDAARQALEFTATTSFAEGAQAVWDATI